MGDVVTLPQARRGCLRTVRSYGTACGVDVMLLTDADPDTVSPLRLSVIGSASVGIEDLAVFPNSDEGRTGADTIAAAVLHALEIADLDRAPGGAA